MQADTCRAQVSGHAKWSECVEACASTVGEEVLRVSTFETLHIEALLQLPN